MLKQELIEELALDMLESFTWSEWKTAFATAGIVITNEDECPYTDEKSVTGLEAHKALELCNYHIDEAKILEADDGNADNGNADQQKKPIFHTIGPATLRGPTIVSQPVYTDNPSPERKLSISQWRHEFQRFHNDPPREGDTLFSEDGSPVRLDIEFYPGKPPFISSRCYIPMIVGSRLGWFAQSGEIRSSFGWKIILVPKSRDEIIKRFGLAKTEVYVKALRIIKRASTGYTYLADIEEF